jgi:hypothetical protein
MTVDEIKIGYKNLRRSSKSALAKAFVKEFSYRDAQAFRARIRGEQPFLFVHTEFLGRMLPQYQDVQISLCK